MSPDDMRFIVARVYGPNAKKWKRKVARMTDAQVCAIYHSMLKRGQIR